MSQEQQHPITPPPELVEQWRKEPEYTDCNRRVTMVTMTTDRLMQLCKKSAQYGADQQLTEDAKWLDQHALDAPHLKITPVGKSLIEAMRPKPPTLNSIALQMLGTIERDAHYIPEITDTIRRALEALPND